MIPADVLTEIESLYAKASCYELDTNDPLGAEAQMVRFRLNALVMQWLPGLIYAAREMEVRQL